MNLADGLTNQACLRPDAIAIDTPQGLWTFRKLEDLAWRIAAHLSKSGIKAGSIAALAFESELTLLITLLATARVGATAFSVPRNTPPILRADLLKRAKAHALVTDRAEGTIADLSRVLIDIDTLAETDARMEAEIHADSPSSPWLIVSGSGSTGLPKLFAVTHEQFLSRIKTNHETLSLSPADRFASLMHLDFTSPKERCLAALFAGATVVLYDRCRQDVIGLCRDRHVTVLDATAFHLEQLLNTLPNGAANKLDMLRVLLLSASTVSDGLRRRIVDSLSPALYVRYGTNEAGPLSIAEPREILMAPGTIGHPPAGVQIEVVDTRGRMVPAGNTGHIRAKSQGMISRYLDDEQATRSTFQNGWFLPGDLGKFDPDGNLIYCGRSDHMMIMNGINIYPAEIEHALSVHPAVRDVAAIPLPSKLHQDIPVCAVVLKTGATVVEKDLLDFARQHLGSHGPHRVVVLDRIPRNEQGKLIRQQLAQEITSKPQHRNSTAPVNAAFVAAPYRIEMARMRQPARQMRIEIHCPGPVSLKAIDDWLQFALEIGIDPVNCPIPGYLDSRQHSIASLTWRILLLARTLLQAAHIPAFDPGCVLSVNQSIRSPSTWQAMVAVTYIENIPPQSYVAAIDESVKFILWMMGMQRSTENTQALYDRIKQRVLLPLQRMVISGKSTIPVLCTAYAQNIPFRHLGAGVYQLGWGSKARRMDRSTSEKDSAIGSKLAQNKVWAASLLRMTGLPAPKHGVVTTAEEATRIARWLGWPVVVKPVDLDRGEGVTVGVRNDDQLQAAFKAAHGRAKGKQVIVEREVGGVCHRLFIANGQLLYAVKRLPKSIHGDGRQTIAELIRAANQNEDSRPPWLRTETFPADQQAIEALASAGLSLESIPTMGERVSLRHIESTAAGGFDEDVTDSIHPDNLEVALRATALFDLDVAGIDIITPDIGRPWHENGAIINEVNFAPLFGGGEISRNHIPEFFSRFMGGDGRIPVEVFVGGANALAAARQWQQALVAQGIACFLTSHDTTLSPTGDSLLLPFTSLFRRCRALLMERRTEMLTMVIQTDELLRTGLPVDRIHRITQATDGSVIGLSQQRQAQLLTLLGTAFVKP